MYERLLPALVLALISGCKRAPMPTVHVAAAADLARAFQEITRTFKADPPSEVKLSLGATGLLARQIEEGAPFDLFLAANSAYVDRVVKAGACDGSTRASYARGRLVLWVGGEDGSELTLARLREPRFRHVAIANPEHAPYGAAAREALTRAGLWGEVLPRLVYGENVQQTFELARSGNAEAAIVGLSLVTDASGGGSFSLLDEALYAPLEQVLVVCKRGSNARAGAELAGFITSPAGRAILRKHGFLLPGEAPGKTP